MGFRSASGFIVGIVKTKAECSGFFFQNFHCQAAGENLDTLLKLLLGILNNYCLKPIGS